MSCNIIEEDSYTSFCKGKLPDPYPLFAQLRREDPVHWSERLGAWVLTRYDDVLALLIDPRVSNNRIGAYLASLPEATRQVAGPVSEHISNWLGFTDPPKHTRLRKILAEVFTPRLAESMKQNIQETVDGLLDKFERSRSIDLVDELAFMLPAAVIYGLMGLPLERRAEFRRLHDRLMDFAGNFGPVLSPEVVQRASAATLELRVLFRGLADERARSPRDDLISRLAVLEARGLLTEQEMVGLCVFTFVAGQTTTASLIANAFKLILASTEETVKLRSSPALVRNAIEEILRYESPLQLNSRVAREPIEIRGRRIRQDDLVLVVLAAANRDPAAFSDPDRLDFARTPNRHLAFGYSEHFCLGAPLARLEAQIAVNTMLCRFPNIRLNDEPIEWIENMTERRPERLRIRV